MCYCTGLLLVAALALSSATVQDVERDSARFRRDLEDQKPQINVNLEWKKFNGSLPNGAVSIYNDYMKRTDYVCKHECEAGFYSPGLDSYCHYPHNSLEVKTKDFDILVNRDNFEFLEWKDGTGKSVPPNSIQTCSRKDIYVSKNKYGLGKLVSKTMYFYLPYEGYEYRYYYRSHQVLTINKDTYSQEISDVKYAFNKAKTIQNKPEVMQDVTTTNKECQTITKSVELYQERSTQTSWDVSVGVTVGIRTTFKAAVPFVAEGEWSVGLDITTDFRYGATHSESTSYKVSMNLEVPPNHSCSVRMEGRRFKSSVPYTARLSRTTVSGQQEWTSISGTYTQVSMGEVRSVLDRCVPEPNPKPCRSIRSNPDNHMDTARSRYRSSSTLPLTDSHTLAFTLLVSAWFF